MVAPRGAIAWMYDAVAAERSRKEGKISGQIEEPLFSPMTRGERILFSSIAGTLVVVGLAGGAYAEFQKAAIAKRIERAVPLDKPTEDFYIRTQCVGDVVQRGKPFLVELPDGREAAITCPARVPK